MKPIVHYIAGSLVFIGLDCVAWLHAVDHPRLGNCEDTRTSRVVSYDADTGRLETLNTVYEVQR